MQIEIRRLQSQDAAQFRELRLKALKDHPGSFNADYYEEAQKDLNYFTDKLSDEWNREDDLIFGAFSNNLLIGTTGVCKQSKAKKKHSMLMWAVYVSPDYRGQKISESLVKTVINHVKTIPGIEKIDLQVEANNIPAKKVYQSLGFKSWGVEKKCLKHNDQYFDQEYMSLQL